MKFTHSSKLLRLSAAALSLGAAMAAQTALAAPLASQSPDVYLGGNIAYSRTSSLGGSIDGALNNQGLASSTSTSTPSATGGLRLGYRLNPNLAFEASYDRIGSTDLQSAITSPAADTASGTWKAHGFGLHVLGIAPLDNQWSAYGRAGIEQWHTSLDTASATGGTPNVSTTGSNTSLALGAGVAYAISPNVDATAELVHYNRVGTSATGTSAVNQVNFGLRYHFL
ncbi:Outer membrane protein beta-barrel domain-containing protein [Polaromonas sp. YR568]|uniref:porin family protein n=1 Tax=Polaromonas sp. YR568 TaxID=1855301 RepID=UPI0008EA7206|nr:outer membrane beta-barrel protein [Polaromonas sp. YR568]SFU49697.1 Outer membrane protein beta-barrel domain-containing protein [Polaromonas sp. YR568]